jgi:hypothetical protein
VIADDHGRPDLTDFFRNFKFGATNKYSRQREKTSEVNMIYILQSGRSIFGYNNSRQKQKKKQKKVAYQKVCPQDDGDGEIINTMNNFHEQRYISRSFLSAGWY